MTVSQGMATPVDNEEARRLVAEEDALLVEVLPEPEYRELHISGAVNIPLKKLTPEAVVSVDRTSPIVVYCYDFL